MSKPHDAILWRRLDRAGHEAARVTSADGLWHISGCAVFVEGELPVRLDYNVSCDASWTTRSASVAGWIGARTIDVQIEVNDERQWLMNGDPQAAVSGCVDVDLNFSPSTNLLPVRRLNLSIGEEAVVRAAWLRFPSFQLEVLEQVYRRTAVDLYEYESAGGSFKAQLRVNQFGFPVEYAGVWQVEASA
ncbi:MAG TPA: putative glycolipid-binding domain-containing protein [Thermoanaerobaculia bacterium]|nr:putative glycolipid-binding domain-containing protein [Thermoanaerobaculia bacterium]